jgi:Uma2 family endonuclease
MSRSAPLAVGLSVDEFMAYDTPDGKAELVRGELRMTPSPGGRHGIVIGLLIARLVVYVEGRKLGRIFSNAGFELLELPRTLRAPDVAYVRANRLPAGGIADGPMRLAPDLVVEVISPSETDARLGEKLDDYRTAGVRLIWLIDPIARTVTVIERDLPTEELGEDDALSGAQVIPGFRCEIHELFDGLARA